MTHRSNHRSPRLIAAPAKRCVREGATSISTFIIITGTGTTGPGMWTRAAS